MTPGRLPVFRATGMIYGDLVRFLRAMPWLAFIALLVLLAANTAEFVLTRHATLGPITGLLKDVALRVAESFFLTPVLIAVHRFILLGEVTGRYLLEPRQPRFERFFAWSLLIWALTAVIGYVMQPLVATVGSSLAVSLTVILIAFAAVLFVTMRLTILFPAIAVDAPGATAANAFADTRGHALPIFFIWFVAAVPVAGFIFIAGTLLSDPKGAAGLRAESYILVVVGAVAQVTGYILLVAMASRVFQALAHRVLRDAPPA